MIIIKKINFSTITCSFGSTVISEGYLLGIIVLNYLNNIRRNKKIEFNCKKRAIFILESELNSLIFLNLVLIFTFS